MSKQSCPVYQTLSLRIKQLFSELQNAGALSANDDLDQQDTVRDTKDMHRKAYKDLCDERDNHSKTCEECNN